MDLENVAPEKEGTSKSSSVAKRTCFVLSPIGKEGTEIHKRFMEVLEYIIKPTFKNVLPKYDVIRADEIASTGSFIKDILEHLYSAHIVIADLSEQNPNVFYELGVRHSLRPRTILIAQSVDDVPSDLREYRTVIYDTTAKGASKFKKKIKEIIEQIDTDPERADNPVLDRLGSVIENKLAQVEEERDQLKDELTKVLSGSPICLNTSTPSLNVSKRFQRILSLLSTSKQTSIGGTFNRGEKSYSIPTEQGDFNLYYIKDGDTTTIKNFWYICIKEKNIDLDDQLADVRVLMEHCSKGQEINIDFIIVTAAKVKDKKNYKSKFTRIKRKLPKGCAQYFKLHILDPDELYTWEKRYGLKV